MCPGKKDCVSNRNKDGSKEKVQDSLLLLFCGQDGAWMLVLLDRTENSRLYVASLWHAPWENSSLQFFKRKIALELHDWWLKYKQWLSTDRSNLEEHEDDFDDFLDQHSSIFFQLAEHYFIVKQQSEFLPLIWVGFFRGSFYTPGCLKRLRIMLEI